MIFEQWQRVKERFPDVLVMMRVGDFMESYQDDARTMGVELGILLLRRTVRDKEYVTMAGIPCHASEACVKELVSKGYKVALVEQALQPDGTVKREDVEVRGGN